LNICLVCSNNAGDSLTAKLDGIKQNSEFVETDGKCKTAFEHKTDGTAPRDKTYTYTDTIKDFGNAFDAFFTNKEDINVCKVNSCKIYEKDCTMHADNALVYVEGGNLKMKLNQKRETESNLCIICKGD